MASTLQDGDDPRDMRIIHNRVLGFQDWKPAYLVITPEELTTSWVQATGLQAPTLVLEDTQYSERLKDVVRPQLDSFDISKLPDLLKPKEEKQAPGKQDRNDRERDRKKEQEVATLDISKQTRGPSWNIRQWCLYWRDKQVDAYTDTGFTWPQLAAGESALPGGALSLLKRQHSDVIAQLSAGGSHDKGRGAGEEEDEADSAFVHQGAVDQFAEQTEPRKGIRDVNKKRLISLTCLCLTNTVLGPPLAPPPALVASDMLKALNQTITLAQADQQHHLACHPATAVINFQINPGGATAWYHVVHGSMVLLLVPPSAHNLSVYATWLRKGPKQRGLLLAEACEGVVKLQADSHMSCIIPGGWPYCMVAVKDTLLVGSHFLHLNNMKRQLAAWEVEELLHVKGAARFPSFKHIMWHAALHYGKVLRVATGLSKLQKQRMTSSKDQAMPTPTVSHNQAHVGLGGRRPHAAAMRTDSASGWAAHSTEEGDHAISARKKHSTLARVDADAAGHQQGPGQGWGSSLSSRLPGKPQGRAGRGRAGGRDEPMADAGSDAEQADGSVLGQPGGRAGAADTDEDAEEEDEEEEEVPVRRRLKRLRHNDVRSTSPGVDHTDGDHAGSAGADKAVEGTAFASAAPEGSVLSGGSPAASCGSGGAVEVEAGTGAELGGRGSVSGLMEVDAGGEAGGSGLQRAGSINTSPEQAVVAALAQALAGGVKTLRFKFKSAGAAAGQPAGVPAPVGPRKGVAVSIPAAAKARGGNYAGHSEDDSESDDEYKAFLAAGQAAKRRRVQAEEPVIHGRRSRAAAGGSRPARPRRRSSRMADLDFVEAGSDDEMSVSGDGSSGNGQGSMQVDDDDASGHDDSESSGSAAGSEGVGRGRPQRTHRRAAALNVTVDEMLERAMTRRDTEAQEWDALNARNVRKRNTAAGVSAPLQATLHARKATAAVAAWSDDDSADGGMLLPPPAPAPAPAPSRRAAAASGGGRAAAGSGRQRGAAAKASKPAKGRRSARAQESSDEDWDGGSDDDDEEEEEDSGGGDSSPAYEAPSRRGTRGRPVRQAVLNRKLPSDESDGYSSPNLTPIKPVVAAPAVGVRVKLNLGKGKAGSGGPSGQQLPLFGAPLGQVQVQVPQVQGQGQEPPGMVQSPGGTRLVRIKLRTGKQDETGGGGQPVNNGTIPQTDGAGDDDDDHAAAGEMGTPAAAGGSKAQAAAVSGRDNGERPAGDPSNIPNIILHPLPALPVTAPAASGQLPAPAAVINHRGAVPAAVQLPPSTTPFTTVAALMQAAVQAGQCHGPEATAAAGEQASNPPVVSTLVHVPSQVLMPPPPAKPPSAMHKAAGLSRAGSAESAEQPGGAQAGSHVTAAPAPQQAEGQQGSAHTQQQAPGNEGATTEAAAGGQQEEGHAAAAQHAQRGAAGDAAHPQHAQHAGKGVTKQPSRSQFTKISDAAPTAAKLHTLVALGSGQPRTKVAPSLKGSGARRLAGGAPGQAAHDTKQSDARPGQQHQQPVGRPGQLGGALGAAGGGPADVHTAGGGGDSAHGTAAPAVAASQDKTRSGCVPAAGLTAGVAEVAGMGIAGLPGTPGQIISARASLVPGGGSAPPELTLSGTSGATPGIQPALHSPGGRKPLNTTPSHPLARTPAHTALLRGGVNTPGGGGGGGGGLVTPGTQPGGVAHQEQQRAVDYLAAALMDSGAPGAGDATGAAASRVMHTPHVVRDLGDAQRSGDVLHVQGSLLDLGHSTPHNHPHHHLADARLGLQGTGLAVGPITTVPPQSQPHPTPAASTPFSSAASNVSLTPWEVDDLPVLITTLKHWLSELNYIDDLPFSLKDPAYLLEQLDEAVSVYYQSIAVQAVLATMQQPMVPLPAQAMAALMMTQRAGSGGSTDMGLPLPMSALTGGGAGGGGGGGDVLSSLPSAGDQKQQEEGAGAAAGAGASNNQHGCASATSNGADTGAQTGPLQSQVQKQAQLVVVGVPSAAISDAQAASSSKQDRTGAGSFELVGPGMLEVGTSPYGLVLRRPKVGFAAPAALPLTWQYVIQQLAGFSTPVPSPCPSSVLVDMHCGDLEETVEGNDMFLDPAPSNVRSHHGGGGGAVARGGRGPAGGLAPAASAGAGAGGGAGHALHRGALGGGAAGGQGGKAGGGAAPPQNKKISKVKKSLGLKF